MEAIEIARKLAALGEQGEACRAYGLVIQSGEDPAGALEGAVYIPAVRRGLPHLLHRVYQSV